MPPVVLEHTTHKGEKLQATFLPEKGMNLISLKKDNLEVIDQSTQGLFEERFAGLGALIGPHFHHRKPEIIPKIKEEHLFPHIARVKAKGILEPFSHGIGRYAPWKAEVANHAVKAQINGKDTWNEIPLSTLEGQNFTMRLDAELKEEGLFLNLSVMSDTSSLVGIHYYFALPGGKGRILSEVQALVGIQGEMKPIPSDWKYDSQKKLIFDLENEADFTFHPSPHPLEGKILLEAEDYRLKISYSSDSAENCWQLYHPLGASFVCIEPISAWDPRHPNLTVSSLKILIEF